MSQRSQKTMCLNVAQGFAQEAKAFAERQFGRPTRKQDLPAVVAALTGEMAFGTADFASPDIRESAVLRLRESLRRERRKSRTGHAGYDFNRHLALHQVLASLGGNLPALVAGKSAT